MLDSVRPQRRQPTRLPRPWDFPGKNTGVGCHFLLQCMKVKRESEVTQSCPTLRDPMDHSLPGSSVHGIFQARVLEWGAIAFSAVPNILLLFLYILLSMILYHFLLGNITPIPWCWVRMKAGGEARDRGWGGWMGSPTQWTWIKKTLRDSKGQGSLVCCVHGVTKSWSWLSDWTTTNHSNYASSFTISK